MGRTDVSSRSRDPHTIAFHKVTPILRVNDLNASLNYYVGVLGFKMDWRDDGLNSFGSISRGDCQLFRSAANQGNSGNWMWIGVSDVDALHEELLGKGATVRHPPANPPWGSRELHIEDPDGEVLRLGSENKSSAPLATGSTRAVFSGGVGRTAAGYKPSQRDISVPDACR